MHLNSYKKKIQVWFFERELKNNTYWAFEVPLNLIFSPVKHRRKLKGYNDTLMDIQRQGMRDPIILLKNTKENYEKPLELVEKKFIKDWNPDRKYLAYAGNSRIEMAKDLNCTSIDAILVENMRWAHAAHLALQGGISHETTYHS